MFPICQFSLRSKQQVLCLPEERPLSHTHTHTHTQSKTDTVAVRVIFSSDTFQKRKTEKKMRALYKKEKRARVLRLISYAGEKRDMNQAKAKRHKEKPYRLLYELKVMKSD